MTFLGELRRRNVFRVAGVYVLVGWLLTQLSGALEAATALPPWFDTLVVASLAIGFPIALVFAWSYELTPEGLRRSEEVAQEESITDRTATRLDFALLLALLLVAGSMLAATLRPPEEPVATAASAARVGTQDAPAEAGAAARQARSEKKKEPPP